MGRSRAAVVFVALLTGCLPPRDNALDSSRSPQAELAVTDTGAEDACNTTPTILLTAASRGRCLSLDASGTSDPQDTQDAQLRFTYSYVSNDGTDEGLIPLDGGDEGPVQEIPSYLKRQLPPNVPHTFRVDVVDPSGARSYAETTFTFFNAAPIAPGFSARTLPLGGLPGSTATTFSVVFDGRGWFDPDGDDVTHAWRFDVNGTVETAEGDYVVREFPVDVRARYLAELVVSDQDLASSPSIAEVSVRTPNLWVGRVDDLPFKRLDSLRQPFDLPGANPLDPLAVRLVGFDGHLVAATFTSPGSFAPILSILDRDSANVIGPVALGANGEAIAVDERNGILSVLERSSPRVLSRWNAADLSSLGSLPLPAIVEEANEDAAIAVTDGGDTWVVGLFGGGAYVVTSAGALSIPYAPDDTRWVTGVAARPGSSEVWMLETRDPFHPDATGGAVLLRYRAGVPPLTPERFEVGQTYATGLAFADADRVWLALPDVGLVLVDVTMLDEDASDLAFGIERVFPQVQNVVRLLTDEVTGTCWASSFSELAYRVGRDLTVVAVPNPLLRRLLFVDPDGALWFLTNEDGTLVQRGSGPATDGTVANVASIGANNGTLDPVNGGLLVSRAFPPALLRYSETGNLVDRMELVQTSTDLGPTPPLIGVRASPNGDFLWAQTVFGRDLVRIDVTLSVPVLEEILAQPAVSTWFANGEVDQYVPTLTGFGMWGFADGVGMRDIVEIRSGSVQSHVTMAPTEGTPELALAPESGRLCVLTQDAGQVFLRLLQEGETSPLFEHTIAVGATSGVLVHAGASVSPMGEDVCWGVFREALDPCLGATHVIVWRASDAAPVGAIDVATAATDVYFESRDALWFQGPRCDPLAGESSLTVVRRNQNGDLVESTIAKDVAAAPFLQLFSN